MSILADISKLKNIAKGIGSTPNTVRMNPETYDRLLDEIKDKPVTKQKFEKTGKVCGLKVVISPEVRYLQCWNTDTDERGNRKDQITDMQRL